MYDGTCYFRLIQFSYLHILLLFICKNDNILYTNRLMVFKVPLVKSNAPDKGLATRPTIP